ncbi:MAG: exo-alpha-sialidase [Myxococcaceae bacterium]|nr:exo-alpha-sialidase [Myxococcaceae bacterium]
MPDAQTPAFSRGVLAPDGSVPCTPVDGGPPQTQCNHHGSTVVELGDGTIAIAWFHGLAEKSLDSRHLWSRRPPGGTFSAPELLYDDPDRSEGNVALWRSERGELLQFFVSLDDGKGWGEARMRLRRSSDDGLTFSAPVTLLDEDCFMIRGPPVRLRGGEVLLPTYAECLAVPTFVRSRDDFATWAVEKSWHQGTWFLDHVGQIQPVAVVRGDGRVSIVTRDGTMKNRIGLMVSTDEKATKFTPTQAMVLPNPGAAVAQTRLADGHTVIIFNNSPDGRHPLSAAVSDDEGETIVAIRDLVTEECLTDECSYPAVTQSLRDGTIWVSYTHNRKTIGWVQFNEAWLREGQERPQVTCPLGETCNAGTCSGCTGGACFEQCIR